MTREHDITGLLRDASNGDAEAGESLYQNIYDELTKISRAQRRRWSGNDTLSTAALVNEAYLKLAGAKVTEFRDRTHFFATASHVMRQVLLDYAKRASAAKRGGDAIRVTLSSVAPKPDTVIEDVVLIDALLNELEDEDARCARVFECRVFAGMTIDETASALAISPATVKRDWSYVTAWIYQRMGRSDEAPS